MDAQGWAERVVEGLVAGITRWLLDKIGTWREKKSAMEEKGALPEQNENYPAQG